MVSALDRGCRGVERGRGGRPASHESQNEHARSSRHSTALVRRHEATCKTLGILPWHSVRIMHAQETPAGWLYAPAVAPRCSVLEFGLGIAPEWRLFRHPQKYSAPSEARHRTVAARAAMRIMLRTFRGPPPTMQRPSTHEAWNEHELCERRSATRMRPPVPVSAESMAYCGAESNVSVPSPVCVVRSRLDTSAVSSPPHTPSTANEVAETVLPSSDRSNRSPDFGQQHREVSHPESSTFHVPDQYSDLPVASARSIHLKAEPVSSLSQTSSLQSLRTHSPHRLHFHPPYASARSGLSEAHLRNGGVFTAVRDFFSTYACAERAVALAVDGRLSALHHSHNDALQHDC